MDANSDNLSAPGETPSGTALETAPIAGQPAFFQRADWLAFWITTASALSIYFFTLAPEVTLEYSGIFSAGAMYAGVPHPPGYPLWTLYAWVFTKVLPVSNIAWRVAVSSAVAAALACGVVTLVVSRGGGMLLEGINSPSRLTIFRLRTSCWRCGRGTGCVSWEL